MSLVNCDECGQEFDDDDPVQFESGYFDDGNCVCCWCNSDIDEGQPGTLEA